MEKIPELKVRFPDDYAEGAQAFGQLLRTMDELREHCPWDQQQTLESIRHLSIEEVYELSEAILNHDVEGIRSELGDLLLHVVFYARIARENSLFSAAEVIRALIEKLVRRHPHVFGQTQVAGASQVIENWERIKQSEKQGMPRKGVLDGVPTAMPGLLKAFRMQEKASAVGFDWAEAGPAFAKVREELDEFRAELGPDGKPIDARKAEAEFGDVLFALVNYARFAGINPEDALERSNRKFRARFEYMEQQALATGNAIENLALAEMDALWDEAKAIGL